MRRQMRLYRFVVEVLDEADCSDEELEAQMQESLEAYFEAIDVSVELVDAAPYLGDLEEMAEA